MIEDAVFAVLAAEEVMLVAVAAAAATVFWAAVDAVTLP